MPEAAGACARTDTGVKAKEFSWGNGMAILSNSRLAPRAPAWWQRSLFLKGRQFGNQAVTASNAVVRRAKFKREPGRQIVWLTLEISQLPHQTRPNVFGFFNKDPAFGIRNPID